MASRISVLVINARDPRTLSQFWCRVLGWRPTEQEDVDVRISAPPGSSGLTDIDFLGVPEQKSGLNRLHLDLRAEAGGDQAGEVARLEALGARRVNVGQGPEVSWVVLADPEGNEFCVLSGTAEATGP